MNILGKNQIDSQHMSWHFRKLLDMNMHFVRIFIRVYTYSLGCHRFGGLVLHFYEKRNVLRGHSTMSKCPPFCISYFT